VDRALNRFDKERGNIVMVPRLFKPATYVLGGMRVSTPGGYQNLISSNYWVLIRTGLGVYVCTEIGARIQHRTFESGLDK
jgi:hypothetical protein